MAPTRELALQISLEARRLSFRGQLQTACIYGGASTGEPTCVNSL